LSATRSVILVVDNEPSMLVFVPALLDRMGVGSLTAAGGRQAVAVLRDHPEEAWLVLLEMDLPGMDGRATWEALRAVDPDLRCCFMTGGGVPRDLRKLLASGVEFFLPKPFSAPALAKIVSRSRPG
jgi:two-component system, cell cycle sensor histidine kinase and response regulator CckA